MCVWGEGRDRNYTCPVVALCVLNITAMEREVSIADHIPPRFTRNSGQKVKTPMCVCVCVCITVRVDYNEGTDQ